MERLVITIHPTPSDAALLSVADAMQQVIDLLRLYEEAENAIASEPDAFVWRLERASTNSPFTVVARAEGGDAAVDVDAHVRRVKSEVSAGVRGLVLHGHRPPWMGPAAISVASALFARTRNGIGRTEIESGPGEILTISRPQAERALSALEGMTAINVVADVSDREVWGEIQGVMVAAGRYRNKPALQIKTDQYGFFWCQLSNDLAEPFGAEHTMSEVWEGQTLGVEGRLYYAKDGKLSWILATGVRVIDAVPPIDLDSVLDPNFTAGLDPTEYLRQLHEGELAG